MGLIKEYKEKVILNEMGDYAFDTDNVPFSDYTKKPTLKGTTNLKWNIDYETRDWGIKNFSVIVPDQEVIIVSEDDEEIPYKLVNVSSEIRTHESLIHDGFVLKLDNIEIQPGGKCVAKFGVR